MLMPLDWNPAGSDNIDGDPPGRQLPSHAARPADLTALGSYIGAKILYGAMEHLAGDVNDAAPLLFFHVGQAALGEQERTLDEEINHALIEGPVVFLDRLQRLRAGRVNNENVRLAKF